MCDACKKWYAALPLDRESGLAVMPLQSDLSDVALAKFKRAQKITDPKKLYAMLPNWIKAHDRAAAPKPRPAFVPQKGPVFPPLPTGADWNAKYGRNSAKRRGRDVEMRYVA